MKTPTLIKTPINPDFLPVPEASFNRAFEISFGEYTLLSISGTASVGPERETMYPDDFQAQVEQTYKNIVGILDERKFSLTDVVKWRVYLKDITRDYAEFNKARDAFFKRHNIMHEDVGASVCIEAKLCREDLLVEMEVDLFKKNGFDV